MFLACTYAYGGVKNLYYLMQNTTYDNAGKSFAEGNDNIAASEKVVIRKADGSEIGKEVICPVMGTKFIVKKSTDVGIYKGKAYYFCCRICGPQFQKNPDKYIK